MPAAEDLSHPAPAVWNWSTYDPSIKSDLGSTALKVADRTYLIDPIHLAINAREKLSEFAPFAAIIVTNENHLRATKEFAQMFSIPILAGAAIAGLGEFTDAIALQDGELISESLTVLSIDGGPAGEIALHNSADGGTLIVGDALINFEPHGFGFLPAKYCRSAKRMRCSLRKLLDHSFERIFFAHGTPVVTAARRRVEELLESVR